MVSGVDFPFNQSIESGFLREFLSAVARSSRGNAVPGISAKPTFEVAGGEKWIWTTHPTGTIDGKIYGKIPTCLIPSGKLT